MNMFDYSQDTIRITEYNLAGKLPNPFVFDDGSLVKTQEDWRKRREEIWKSAVELQFGERPPSPEFLEVEVICTSGKGRATSYRITTGTRERPVSFLMMLFKTDRSEKAPVVISGDLCFPYAFDKAYIHTFLDNGINFCTFNRCELAPDVAPATTRHLFGDSGEMQMAQEIIAQEASNICAGQLRRTYPDVAFSTTGAWAWGYSRCVDALEILENVDLNMIAFTGHSRGAKTAILAGVWDERAAIVNPNETCAGGCSCYRLDIKAIREDGVEKPSESIGKIFARFPSWMGKDLKEYVDREAELPFDSHYLKALVAPRVLLVGEAASDIWANPVGSWQTSKAAGEVYKFLGCEDNLLWYFRRGEHFHHLADIGQLVNVIKHYYEGAPLNDHYFKTPFKPMEPAYDWRAPSK